MTFEDKIRSTHAFFDGIDVDFSRLDLDKRMIEEPHLKAINLTGPFPYVPSGNGSSMTEHWLDNGGSGYGDGEDFGEGEGDNELPYFHGVFSWHSFTNEYGNGLIFGERHLKWIDP
jgi:hypothetical protein